MTINAITLKLFGTKGTIYRVLDKSGEVVKVCNTREEAEAWMSAQK